MAVDTIRINLDAHFEYPLRWLDPADEPYELTDVHIQVQSDDGTDTVLLDSEDTDWITLDYTEMDDAGSHWAQILIPPADLLDGGDGAGTGIPVASGTVKVFIVATRDPDDVSRRLIEAQATVSVGIVAP